MLNKKSILTILCVICSIISLLVPFPKADVHLKIYFDEIEGNECALYYETEDTEGYAAERCIMADVEDNTYVDFHIEASIAEKITGIRIDMPDTGVEQLICIKNFTVNSAGIIQKSLIPVIF